MSRRSKAPDWTVANTQKQAFECKRCGGTRPFELPASIEAFVADAEAFGVRHRDCEEPSK